MLAGRVDGKVLPLGEVRRGGLGVVHRVGGVVGDCSDEGHGLDTDDTFDGKVRLVYQLTSEIIWTGI